MAQNTYSFDDLIYLMQQLRNPEGGCPWDLEQNYKTIAPSTLEEAYEVVDAIERDDKPALREELGDLLFQTIFYTQLSAEEGLFDIHNVVSDLVAKLVRRHPHVFPSGHLYSSSETEMQSAVDQSDADQVLSSWEDIKKNERQAKGLNSALDDVPVGLPSLSRAQKLQKRASKSGFDWREVQPVFAKVDEEMQELQEAVAQYAGYGQGREDAIEEEMGDLLFTCVNLARHLGVDSETALRRANQKFEKRFRHVETQVKDNQQLMEDLDPEQLESHWQQAKLSLSE